MNEFIISFESKNGTKNKNIICNKFEKKYEPFVTFQCANIVRLNKDTPLLRMQYWMVNLSNRDFFHSFAFHDKYSLIVQLLCIVF